MKSRRMQIICFLALALASHLSNTSPAIAAEAPGWCKLCTSIQCSKTSELLGACEDLCGVPIEYQCQTGQSCLGASGTNHPNTLRCLVNN